MSAEVFKIQTSLDLTGSLGPDMLKLLQVMERVEIKTKDVQKKLNALRLGKGAVDGLATLERKVSGLESVVGRAVDAANKKLSSITLGAKPHESVTAFRDHLGTLTSTADRVGSAMRSELVGSLGTVRTEARTVREAIASWGTEITTVERRIADLSNRMRGASAGSRSIRYGRGGHGGGDSPLDVLAMGPQHSGVFAGMNVEHGLGGLLEANGELQRQLNLYRMSGASDASVAAARAAAFKSATLVPDVGVSEQAKLFRELVGATGDEKGSILALPDAAKTMSIMGAVTGRHSEEDMKRLFKFIELRGIAIDEHSHKIDVDKFGGELNYATKAMVAAQGLITSNDMLQFAKQAGPMAKGMSGDELFSTMLASMEDMGGARAGTSLTAVGRQFIGGIMTGGKAKRLDELGMLNQAGVDRSNPDKPVITDPTKAIVGYDVLTKQGFGVFMDTVFRQHLADHGIGERQKQNEELYRSVGTDTARRLMGLYLSGHEQVGIVAGRFHQAMGASQGYDTIFGNGQDLQTSVKALSESVKTLKTALGDAAGVSPMLMSLARGISGLADAAKDHPALGSVATLGGVGGSAALLGYGALQTVKGFGLPAAAAELTTAAKMLQGVAAGPGGPQGQPGGKPGLWGTLAGALGLYGLAEAAQSQNVLAAPKTSDGFWKNVLNFLDPGLAGRVIGDGIKGPAEEAGKAAGKATTSGFRAEDFTGAGAAAGKGIIAGLASVLGRLGGMGDPEGLIQHTALVGGLGGGGGGGGGFGVVPGGVSMSERDRNLLGLISQHESGGRNVMNYIGNRTHTAQGYYQITNSNWRKIAPRLGISAPNAMSASMADQARVALELLHNRSGIHNWSDFNPRLRGALGRGDRYRAAPTAGTRPSPSIPQQGRDTVVHTAVHLDGRKVAANTTRHQFIAANGPATGASFADSSELYPQV